jgi:hypothetical protein
MFTVGQILRMAAGVRDWVWDVNNIVGLIAVQEAEP